MPYHIDYETRSRQELSDTGAYKYAECPDARILLAAISHDDEGPYLWVHPDYETGLLATDPRATEMLERMEHSEELIYAHNCGFERAVTRYRAYEDLGLRSKPIDPTRWRCTQAMARKAQIPDSLEMAAQTLGLDAQKDARGKALIKKFSVPRDDGTFMLAFEDPAAFAEFGEYCLQDVRVERELHKRLAPFELSGIALEAFLLDIYLNDRGVPVNVPALQNASRILAECYVTANAEFRALTGLNPTQREKVRQWCNDRGAALDNMQGPTLEAWLDTWHTACADMDRERPFAEPGTGFDQKQIEAARAVEMYAHLNFAAAKKVDVMLACVNSDGVVRGTLLWHGAGTGRWSGRLIQPQNFKKPSIKDTEIAYRMICNGCTREELESLFGNPLEVIASCIRHFIHVSGQEMLDADYNAVEARIANWVAGQDDVVKLFRESDNWTGPKELKPDPYKTMAAFVYNKRPQDIANGSVERDVGKTLELGCQFGLAWETLLKNCQKKGITYMTPELAKLGVEKYRESHYKVKQCWWDCDKAAKNAILQPGRWFNAGDRLSFCVKRLSGMDVLLTRLPSGRTLSYPKPEIVPEPEAEFKARLKKNPHARRREGITFWGLIKGKTWGRCRLYSSLIFQNAVQAIAGDLIAYGMAEARRKLFDLFTSIHDQALSLRGAGQTADAYATALATLPPWAGGLPLKAEAKIVPFYKK